MKRTSAAQVILTAAALSAGCSIFVKKDPQAEAAFEQRRARLETIHSFTSEARVSAGLFGVKGSLHWRQRGELFQMRFAGPLGANAVNIFGDGTVVHIRTAQDSFRTTDPDRFLHEHLGWTFPVRQLRWWVLGVPAPGATAGWELDGAGRMTALEQDGWTIEFTEYAPAGTLDLPRKFALVNDEVTIKVVVDRWTDVAGAT